MRRLGPPRPLRKRLEMTTGYSFDSSHAPRIGAAETLESGLRVVTAPNGGPMTFTGTRSYILGRGDVAVIDPGPDDPAHLEALAAAFRGERVTAILVTHAHRDHSAGARALAFMTGATVYAHGDPAAARSELMADLAARWEIGGGEGIDADFSPGTALRDGDTIEGGDWRVTAIHTPGHLSDHMSFLWRDRIFSGDVAMGWATTLISPPDGDLAEFRRSIARLRSLGPARLYPGHGAPVEAPDALLAHLLAHRQRREDQITDALAAAPATIADLVARLYSDVDPRLHGAAARNVLAHLIDLGERGLAEAEGGFDIAARFRLVPAR